MDTREKDIEKLKDYKYGFTTDIENIKAPKGLNEDVIKFISNKAVQFQSGYIYDYAFVMLIGLSALISCLILN